MKFLPFENITLHTQLPGREVLKRLSQNLEPLDLFPSRFNRTRKLFEGEIKPNNEFDIRRVIWYKNGFLPRITGKITEEETSTAIKLKLRLHVFPRVFMTFFCSIVFLVLLVGIANLLSSKTLEEPGALIGPLIMLILGYGMTIGGFKYESTYAKEYLAEIFEAEIENTSNKKYKK